MELQMLGNVGKLTVRWIARPCDFVYRVQGAEPFLLTNGFEQVCFSKPLWMDI